MNTERKAILRDYWAWAAILVITLLIGAIRVHLIDIPLERDEGEYAYAGQLILKGLPPYSYVYSMKLPGAFVLYAFFIKAFGQSAGGIHFGLLLVNALTAIFIFLIGKKLFSPLAGVMSGAAFLVLTLSESVLGLSANTEHFVILFVTAELLLVLRFRESRDMKTLFLCGFLLGTGVLMKQHGAVFIVFSIIYLFIIQARERVLELRRFIYSVLFFFAGSITPYVAVCFVFLYIGIFDKFWFWTFAYAHEYASSVDIANGVDLFWQAVKPIFLSSPFVWSISAAGLAWALWRRASPSRFAFTAVFFILSFFAVMPGFYFRGHYFILLLPSTALLFGSAVSAVYDMFRTTGAKFAVAAVAALALIHSAYVNRDIFFYSTPDEVSHKVYGANPFPESLAIARYIRENSNEADRIAIIGSEPQIYFYSGRRSATGYIYTYPIMEEKNRYAPFMRRELIRDVEASRPLFLIFVYTRSSWEVHEGMEPYIFDWFKKSFHIEEYRLVSIAELISPEETRYLQDDKVSGYSPSSNSWVAVYRRKNR